MVDHAEIQRRREVRKENRRRRAEWDEGRPMRVLRKMASAFCTVALGVLCWFAICLFLAM